MTEVTEQADPSLPVLLERGRYALSEMADGSWVIRRAGPLCDTCQSCGCGEQDELPAIPKMFVDVLTGRTQANLKGLMAQVRKAMRNG
jgi:hypothetical protein